MKKRILVLGIALVLIAIVAGVAFAGDIRQGQYKASNGYVLVIVIEGSVCSIKYMDDNGKTRGGWYEGKVVANGISFTANGKSYMIYNSGVGITENYENRKYHYFSEL